MLRVFSGDEILTSLSMNEAIDALASVFEGGSLPDTPARQHLDVGTGELLFMPAWNERVMGVKLVTVASTNVERGLPLIHGSYLLFDATTLAPVALLDGAALTGLRTAAVSGLATRSLARSDASRLLIFGAGIQARWHLEAMRSVRPLSEAVVVARTTEKAQAMVDEIKGLTARAGDPSDVAQADIICTCTTSRTPVFDGGLLAPGTHINAVGAYKPDARELDTTTMARGRIVVELREAALAEAGDVIQAIAEGAISANDIVADLAEVSRGAQVRRDDTDVTIFKSVGAAFEDLVVAQAIAGVAS